MRWWELVNKNDIKANLFTMATQRIISKEKTYLDDDGKGAPEKSDIAPAVDS